MNKIMISLNNTFRKRVLNRFIEDSVKRISDIDKVKLGFIDKNESCSLSLYAMLVSSNDLNFIFNNEQIDNLQTLSTKYYGD